MDNEVQKKHIASIRMTAMNILAGREHSVDELRQKLKRKLNKSEEASANAEGSYTGAEGSDSTADGSTQIEIVLQQLVIDKLLDDARFAECFIRSRINKGSGPVKIRHELTIRGISNELTENFLDNSYDFWQEHIDKVRSKRFGAQYPDDYKEQSRQSRFLYQRGFSSELIQRLFSEHK
jgi:regulatory protein